MPPPVPQPGRLHGRVGLITGAASGIGAAGAELFAAQGAALVLVDVDAARGSRVAGAINARGGRAEFVAGDAASADDVSGAVRLAVARFGRLDLLWANAGIGVAKTVPEMTLDEWDRVLAVNLTGAFLLAKFGLPELAAAGARWDTPTRAAAWPGSQPPPGSPADRDHGTSGVTRGARCRCSRGGSSAGA